MLVCDDFNFEDALAIFRGNIKSLKHLIVVGAEGKAQGCIPARCVRVSEQGLAALFVPGSDFPHFFYSKVDTSAGRNFLILVFNGYFIFVKICLPGANKVFTIGEAAWSTSGV